MYAARAALAHRRDVNAREFFLHREHVARHARAASGAATTSRSLPLRVV
jgi:hypothetical protein